MKKMKHIIAAVLTLCMLISMIPMPAVAAQQGRQASSLSATEIPGLSRLEGTDYNGTIEEN